jgi:hypothetical protein
MKKIFRIIAHTIYAIGLFVVMTMPNNKYDWMQEIDPSIPAHAIEDTSGNSTVFVSLVCIAIIFAQIILIIKAKEVQGKIVPIVLVLLAFIIWGLKFLA